MRMWRKQVEIKFGMFCWMVESIEQVRSKEVESVMAAIER